MKIRPIIIATAALLLSAGSYAQDTVTDASASVGFTNLTMFTDPVALSMGGIPLLQFGGASYAAQGNPGFIPLDRKHIDAGFSLRNWNGRSSLNGGFGVKCGERVGVSVDCSGIFENQMLGMSSSGQILEGFGSKEFSVSAGIGVKICGPLSIGANLRYLNLNTASNPVQALTTDILASVSIVGIRFTGGVTNLKISSSQNAPSAISLAAGYRLNLVAVEMDLGVQADRYFYGSTRVGTGGSFTLFKFVTLRGGYNFGGETHIPDFASAGIGLNVWKLHADVTGMFPTKSEGEKGICIGIRIDI